jgi:hypothetical protein
VAEIDIQEKRGQPMWAWILGILALLVLAGVIWAVTRNGDRLDDRGMERDTLPATPTPNSGMDRADNAVLAYVVFTDSPVQAAPVR